MTEHHNDKNGHELKTGDLIHFEIDGRPYTGVVHALVRRDHEPAVITLAQLFLPVGEVTKDAPKKDEEKAPAEKPQTTQTPKGHPPTTPPKGIR